MTVIPLFLVASSSGQLASDDFLRANNTTLGANWTTCQGVGEGLGILTNQASFQTSGNRNGSYYSAVTAPNDQYSQATAVALCSFSQGVIVRSITSGGVRNNYIAGCNPNSFGGGNTLSRVWKEVAGTDTSLGTGATTLAPGQVWRLEIVGTNLTFKINGVTEIIVSDSDLTAGQFGLWAEHNVSNVAMFDDWSGGAP